MIQPLHTASTSDVAVRVRGLSKAYTITHGLEQESTLAETVLSRLKNPLHRPRKETFYALKDIDLDIKKGEVTGIIGRNGAGKSTLLKVLSRITAPTAGEIDIHGRVGSLLEVGTGFHPELTGRENIFLNGAILGMTRPEIKSQFDAIVDFAGVEQFLDTPVKRYSSGMYVRLAFAVAAHLRTEVLIVDEVLAVGDQAFQNKCIGKMKDVASGEGRTVIFVSHNMASVRNLCTHAVLLRSGVIVANNEVEEVTSIYLNVSTSLEQTRLDFASKARTGSGEVRCTGFRLQSTSGEPLAAVPANEPVDIVLEYTAYEPVRGVCASIDIDSVEGYRITTLFSGFIDREFDIAAGSGCLVCRIQSLPLFPDQYRVNVLLGGRHHKFDFVQDAAVLEIAEHDVFGTGRKVSRAHGATASVFDWSLS
jgi:lipopolysaccharide transport system ATP-binding protein